jgi:hypothetical protein
LFCSRFTVDATPIVSAVTEAKPTQLPRWSSPDYLVLQGFLLSAATAKCDGFAELFDGNRLPFRHAQRAALGESNRPDGNV